MRSVYTSFLKTTRRLFANQKVVEDARKQDVNRTQSTIESGASKGTIDENLKENNINKTQYDNSEGTKLHDSHKDKINVGISRNVADFTSVNQPESHSIFDNKNRDKTFYKTSKDINLHNNIEKDDIDKRNK